MQSPDYPGERLMVWLQPFAGGGAEMQAGGLIGSHGDSADANRETSGAPQEETVDGNRDRFQGRQGAGALQDGQTLRARCGARQAVPGRPDGRYVNS